jgi:acetate kinase
VGENDVDTRKRISSGMQFLGIHLDEEKNKTTSTAIKEINKNDSPVKILVIPTNEELEIAQQCYGLLQKSQ